MAQMTARSVLVLAFVLCAAKGFAQSAVPPAGLAAEAAGEWAQARDVYRDALESAPHDASLWVRVADIEARMGNVEASASALQHAVLETPHDPALLQRLSQAYAMLDQPVAALDAVERALALSPDSVELLRARGTLATWVADYGKAQDAYRRLSTLAPDDHDVLLKLARVSAWSGRTDAAVEAFKRYVQAEPDAAAVLIELARAEGGRGNYAAALDTLEKYRQRSGADDAYTRERAAVLARAGRPGQALGMLEPMLQQHPGDYELNLTRTIALTMQRKAREASESLETMRRLQPDARDTETTERIVRLALASTAEPGITAYGDSSGLAVQRATPRVTMSLGTGTTVGVGVDHDRLTARSGSGLEQVTGNEFAQHTQSWVSAAQQVGGLNLRGRIGRARAATRDMTTYVAGADFTPTDGLKLSVERNSGFYVVSPRTVGLGLRQVGHRGQLAWSPTIRSSIAVDVLSQTLSDGNRRWEFTIAPRHSVVRAQRLNLDLGVVASQMRTTTNFDNGYYDPRRYEYYAATAYPYWKVSETIGAGLSLALGVQRDDFSPKFRFGGNASGELTFGIFSPWALKVTGGGTLNQRLNSGAFGGYSAGISLIRRF